MSIIYNGTTIENITYNGTTLDTVNYNNTEVFSGTPKTLTVILGTNHINSVIINDIEYFENISISIKSGSSVTLNCTIKDGGMSQYYIFNRWTGYTTQTTQNFTFTMPNEDIEYTANGFNYQINNMPEYQFLEGLNYDLYYTKLTGKTVYLSYANTSNLWRIIRVNSDSFDLWYNKWYSSGNWSSGKQCDWTQHSKTTSKDGFNGDNNPRYLCNQLKSLFSSEIQSRMKTGLNANCGSDKVVILSAKQLGYTGTDIPDDDTVKIPYFGTSNMSIGGRYLTANKAHSSTWDILVDSSNKKFGYFYLQYSSYGIVPAIRIGKI